MNQKHLLKHSTIIILFAISLHTNGQTNTSIQKTTVPKFTEGIVYSRTSFPNHPLNDSIKSLDYEKGDFVKQYHVIQALKKHQQSIKGTDEQSIKDAFFVSGIMVMPAYSKMYFTQTKSLLKTDALGYHQEVIVNKAVNTGKLILADRDKTYQGTINFHTNDLQEVLQKYQVNAEQYSLQKTNETAVIAGYPCKKIIYTFGGTTRGLPVSNYVINLEPRKVTVWYSDDLPPAINHMHAHYFELNKAILKYEVEYDKNKKNKIQAEIMKVEPQKIEEEIFDRKELAPSVEHKKGSYEGGMMIMQVMMSAISLLSK